MGPSLGPSWCLFVYARVKRLKKHRKYVYIVAFWGGFEVLLLILLLLLLLLLDSLRSTCLYLSIACKQDDQIICGSFVRYCLFGRLVAGIRGSDLDKAGTLNMGLILHSGLHTRIIWVPIGPTTGPILELLGPI